MYDIYSNKAEEFIDDEEIKNSIEFAKNNKNNITLIDEILKKAETLKGLSHKEALVLLLCEIKEKNLEIFKLAKKIKNYIYGNRVVIFAPLYISNYCVNGCSYCPYCFNQKTTTRKKLTQQEIKNEIIALGKIGHKRIALEAGEDDKNCPLEYILNSIDTIYDVKNEYGNNIIRRINVNIAATTVENYEKLKEKNIGTYILFQETYNKNCYEKYHKSGPKKSYSYHTTAMDRALTAGIKDIGCGVLFGLGEYEYDFAALLMHKEHLEANFKIGPHTISVPRIKKANGIELEDFNNKVDDETFLKIIACFRIAVPYTGLIISTRENKQIREIALSYGVSQISGGSLTSVGGYEKKENEKDGSAQFETEDKRNLDEIIRWLLELKYIPSFCTACYRKKRIGEDFMKISKSGEIKNFCTPNAILTLKEYLTEFALQKTKEIGENLIKNEIEKINNENVKNMLCLKLKEIENKKQDYYF